MSDSSESCDNAAAAADAEMHFSSRLQRQQEESTIIPDSNDGEEEVEESLSKASEVLDMIRVVLTDKGMTGAASSEEDTRDASDVESGTLSLNTVKPCKGRATRGRPRAACVVGRRTRLAKKSSSSLRRREPAGELARSDTPRAVRSPASPPHATAGMAQRALARSVQQPLRATRRPVACTAHGPHLLHLAGDPPLGLRPPTGCSFVDIHFHMPTTVYELSFRNHYTARLTVFVRAVHYTSSSQTQPKLPQQQQQQQQQAAGAEGAGGKGDAGDEGCDANLPTVGDSETAKSVPEDDGERWPWEASVPSFTLMPHPNCENGAQDFFTIYHSQSKVPWRNLLSMRLLLRQPSPCWLLFSIRKLLVFSEPSSGSPEADDIVDGKRLFISDAEAQRYNHHWRKVQLNTINSMTPVMYRPPSSPGSQLVPDYEINTL